jgi:hypothetical protein
MTEVVLGAEVGRQAEQVVGKRVEMAVGVERGVERAVGVVEMNIARVVGILAELVEVESGK